MVPTRETDKSIILPDITRSSETIEHHNAVDASKEYKDWYAATSLKTVNSISSLRSFDIQNKQIAKYNKKPKINSKNINRAYKEVPNFSTPNDSQYVEVYKKQKCSFMHLENNTRKGLKGAKMPKSQTRKSILPILAPDHYEALMKQQNMVIKLNKDKRNVDKSLSFLKI